MKKKNKYYGLCETCEHDPTCMLRRSTKLEIIQCEEFSIQPVISNSNSGKNGKSAVDESDASRLGLCANCLNMATCGFPNARQGVLQCEEHLLGQDVTIPNQSEYSVSAA